MEIPERGLGRGSRRTEGARSTGERRMFGGSLPHAWPAAAVALHFLDGFAERFAEAVVLSERLLEALATHRRVTIERRAAAP